MGFSEHSESRVQTMLEMLSRSTGDIYLFYDAGRDRLQFSRNILRERETFRVCRQQCTLEEWRRGVDERDLPRLKANMEALAGGRADTYNLNYRALDGRGLRHWVNSRGGAHRDGPTGRLYLLGRLALAERPRTRSDGPALAGEVCRQMGEDTPFLLLMAGVDEMRNINLTKGRAFGDGVLRDVQSVLGDESGRQVYRVNGDWFALCLPGAAEARAQALFERAGRRLSGQCSLSAGCVAWPRYRAPDERTLFQYAETALQAAKDEGRGRLHFFAPWDYEGRLRELELRAELQAGVQKNFEGYQLFYQPQVLSGSHKLYGAEALLRFCSPSRGQVLPEEFVPILEKSGLIRQVGLWALGRALADCRRWRRKNPDLRVSVNMSYVQLEEDAVEDEVLRLVEESGLPGSALTIEITESRRLSDYFRLNRFFRRWKKAGIELSVDDFGTGYSSLERLGEMEVDEIKVDRRFVSGLPRNAYNCRLLGNILELAESCGIRVCCEGVETPEELELLEKLSPDLLQGFYFAQPCPAARFEAEFAGAGQPFKPSPRPAPGLLCRDPGSEDEIAGLILEAENDVVYLADMETHEMYYLNRAGRKLFGVKDCQGRKCYQVLRGRDRPCPFCSNGQLGKKDFLVWESRNDYCRRRFLVKTKQVEFRGRPARLEVALDITRRELVSPAGQERLALAERIGGCIEALGRCGSWPQAAARGLALLGEFYQADRVRLFCADPKVPGRWNDAFEWHAPAVPSLQKEERLFRPDRLFRRWLEEYGREQPVILLDLDSLRAGFPEERQMLSRHNVQRLIIVPLEDEKGLAGFVGVANPRYRVGDASQAQAMAGLLLLRLRRDQAENRPDALPAGPKPC